LLNSSSFDAASVSHDIMLDDPTSLSSSERYQKPNLGQNVRIKIPDIDKATTDAKSTAVITDIKDEEFY
jgi:hypothetical protein